MPRNLSKTELFDLVLRSIEESDWRFLVLDRGHPFLIRAYDPLSARSICLRIYIWNCTHGGGSARAPDEYRVQLTGAVPHVRDNETTLILGWHQETGVYVAFDIIRHADQATFSPSIQVKRATLENAYRCNFSSQVRKNGEVAIAFRPEFFINYALKGTELHQRDSGDALIKLERLPEVTDGEIDNEVSVERREIVRTIRAKYRSHDFRRRVISAYSASCGICGVQLKLIDAAHILPVASGEGGDETNNGIALCKLHHAAFDNNLISFDPEYRIEVSEHQTVYMRQADLAGGLDQFCDALRTIIQMPADKRDYPNPELIARSRELRDWRP